MRSIQFGKMKHRITIEQPVNINTTGGVDLQWSTFLTAWASVEPLKENEQWVKGNPFDKYIFERRLKIVMRYRSGVTAKMRVRTAQEIIDIVGVINTGEQNRELVLICQDRGSKGVV